MTSLSIEYRNYFKLVRLLDRSCVSLRLLFKNRYSQFNNGTVWDDSPTCGKSILTNMTAKNKKKYRYAETLIENGDSNKWDLSILPILLLETDRPTTLSSSDIQRLKEEDERIEKLIIIRNKIEHHPAKSMTKAEFEQMWDSLSQILLTFGDVTPPELDELKDDKIFNPSDRPINEENVEKAKEFNCEGTKEHKAKKYFEAIAQFTKAIDLSDVSDGDRAVFYTNRSLSRLKLHEQRLNSSREKGETFTDLRDLQFNALLDAKKARELSLTSWKAHFRVGQAYASIGEHEKALRSFEAAFALSPANETIQKALDESRSMHSRQLRQKHLDPRVSPGSISQLFNEAQQLLGTDIATLRSQINFIEKIDPDAAAVFKGHQFRYGDEGIEQDYEQAVKYYTKAAEQGNAEGIYNLAYLTDRGLGVKKDLVRAHKLYEQAAAQRSEPLEYGRRRNVGVAESEYELGLRYAEGIVVHKHLATAVIWFERAIEHESDEAANKLGEMYQTGAGVVRNLGKAEELYEIAARRGDPDAMYHLAKFSLSNADLKMARIWYARAVKAGSITARANSSQFEIMCQKMQQMRDKNPSMVSQAMDLVNNLQNSMKLYDSSVTKMDSPSECGYDVEMLHKYVKRGSPTAKRMLSALEHCYQAMSLILVDDNLAEDQQDEFVHELSQCFCIEHIMTKYPNKKMLERTYDIVNQVLRRCNSESKLSKSKLDVDARICYAHLHFDSRDLICQFLDECIAKYPKILAFYNLKADLYGWLKEFDKAIYEANRGLEIDHNHSDLLFAKAVALRLLERDMNAAINAYQLFLEKAPKDHRHAPDGYYEMGTCYMDMRKQESQIDKIREIYKQGQEAEKLQLPCFLPFHSNAKILIEGLLNIVEGISTKSKISGKKKNRLMDPHRIEIIVEQRHWKAASLRNKQNPNIMKFPHSLPARVKQKAPKSLVGLRPISIKEMDPRTDRIYEGRVLTVKIIEEALDWQPSIHLIVEDECSDCERLYIYNCTKDEGEYLIKEVYKLGRQMHVIDPYLRIGAYDCKPTIRIDDSSSIILENHSEPITNPCQCCGKLNATHVCSKCHQTRYCSKQCQTTDWKTYKHDLICQK